VAAEVWQQPAQSGEHPAIIGGAGL
jgi:hypothetical protein